MVGFIEEISINTSLLRRIIKTPKLKMERFIIGTLSQTEVVVSYIEGIADAGILSEIRERLNRIDTDVIIDSGFLEGFIEDNPFSIFPQITNTERPDTSAAALAEGRFVILVDGTPFVLIVPTTFSYFLVAAEDYYDRFYFATFVRMLRYFAFALALFGPAVYIGITTFHPEMIPTSLFISIAVSRADVPFPALAEAMLMEVTFELMREASARLPTIIGQSLSIVGALVIGQTAVQAGLVSSALIIVVAVTGIASFSIPKFHIARAVRLLRFPMMLLAATMGLYGIIMGVLMLMIHMASIRSFGVPFLSPLAPINIEGWKDVFIRFPFWAMNKRPVFIQQNNVTRTKKDLMPKPPTKN
jgi:spore germination protein KA